MSGGFGYRLDGGDVSLVDPLQLSLSQVVHEIEDDHLRFTLDHGIASDILEDILGQEGWVDAADHDGYARREEVGYLLDSLEVGCDACDAEEVGIQCRDEFPPLRVSGEIEDRHIVVFPFEDGGEIEQARGGVCCIIGQIWARGVDEDDLTHDTAA